jgi:hypothetical protein
VAPIRLLQVHIPLLPSPLLLSLLARLNTCSCAILDPPGEGFLLGSNNLLSFYFLRAQSATLLSF